MILVLGDSKSAPDTQTWGYQLAGFLGMRALELGRGGYTVQKIKDNLTVNNDGGTFSSAIIPSALTNCETSSTFLDRCQQALHDQEPPYILLNLGVNDVGFTPPWTLPNQTTWQNNYISIIDTLHTQWPNAQIYITKPWKSQPGGDDTMWNTMAGWVDNVVAARSTFTFVLDDERSWFKPNAATYSSDSIHYNATGQTAAANAKRIALGF